MKGLAEKMSAVIARQEELAALMAAGKIDAAAFTAMSREYAELSPIVEKAKAVRCAAERRLPDWRRSSRTRRPTAEMRALGGSRDAAISRAQLPELERELKLLLLPKDEADERNAILEVRAGTGGDEAALFAADLFRMYQRYAEGQGWTLRAD